MSLTAELEILFDQCNDHDNANSLIDFIRRVGDIFIFRIVTEKRNPKDHPRIDEEIVRTVRCTGEENTKKFLLLVLAKWENKGSIDFDAVQSQIEDVNSYCLGSLAERFVDGYEGDVFPYESSKPLDWIIDSTRIGIIKHAELAVTANWGEEIPLPTQETHKSSLLTFLEYMDNETEGQMEDCMNLDKDSLEYFLCLQHLTNGEYTDLVYVRYQICYGLWLTPEPKNIEYLELTINSWYFNQYYLEAEKLKNIRAWLEAAEKRINPEEHSDEAIELFKTYSAKYL